MLVIQNDFLTGISRLLVQTYELSLSSSGITQVSAQLCNLNMFSTGIVSCVATNFNLPKYISVDIFSFIFGESAIQTATQLVISKSDLPGLSPAINNTAESILVGIICRLLALGNINFIKFSIIFWGAGRQDNSRIATVNISFYKLLTLVDGFEYTNYDSDISPMDF